MSDPRPSATVAAESEDGLRPAVQALRRQWIVAVATFLLVAGLGMLYVLRMPTEYEAGAVVSFMPRVASTVGGEVTSLLVERYPEVVASGDSIDAAAAAAGVDPAAVSAGLQAGIQPETLNLVFSATLPTNDQALAATEAIYDNLLQVNRTDPDLRAVPVSEPVGWGPTGASTTLWTAAVMIAAVALAFTVALVADGLRRRKVTRNPSSE